MQLVRGLRVAEDDDEGPVKELRAVDLYLIGKCVPRELRDVSLQVQYVQT